MDEFKPYPPYNPEDEYAPIEPEITEEADQPVSLDPSARVELPIQPEEAQPSAAAESAQAQPDTAQAQPVPQYIYPPAGYQAYPQQAYPQQGYVQPPFQAQQPGVYPGYAPQYMQNPAQQYYQPVQTPAQPVLPQAYPQPQAYSQAQTPVQPMPQAQTPVQPMPQAQTPVQPNTYNGYPQQAANYPGSRAANPYKQASYAQPAVAPEQPVKQELEPGETQKTRTSTGTKVFIICLCALLVAMIVGFGIYIAKDRGDKQQEHHTDTSKSKPESTPESTEIEDPFGFGIIGDEFDTDSYSEIEDTITLVPDNGETQKRDTDNSESVGTPDEKAAPLVLNELPKDKADPKYTTQSAYEKVSDSVVTVECFRDKITENDRDIIGSGSGTIISSDGYIITNAHVIGNAKEYLVSIIMNNGKKYQAKIVGYDTWTDLAVLKIDAKDLKPVSFGDSKLINVGDDVIAIGSPGGEKFQNSLTKGIVSAVDREISINRYVRYIQSDAAISPGNSGGALCNIYGQVIGITTAKTIATNYENMSFSIPSETVKTIVDDLMRYGYVKGRCRIGLTGIQVSDEEIAYYGYPAGIVISDIDKDGSLGGSDIKAGDILVELDGIEITSFQDIYDILADHKPGDKVTVKAIRYDE